MASARATSPASSTAPEAGVFCRSLLSLFDLADDFQALHDNPVDSYFIPETDHPAQRAAGPLHRGRKSLRRANGLIALPRLSRNNLRPASPNTTASIAGNLTLRASIQNLGQSILTRSLCGFVARPPRNTASPRSRQTGCRRRICRRSGCVHHLDAHSARAVSKAPVAFRAYIVFRCVCMFPGQSFASIPPVFAPASPACPAMPFERVSQPVSAGRHLAV
jgi:hypothetical protein